MIKKKGREKWGKEYEYKGKIIKEATKVKLLVQSFKKFNSNLQEWMKIS